MNIFFTLFSVFVIGASFGWVLELLFRRTVHGKWINPGFMTGPCLPLYGFWHVLLYLFCMIDFSFIGSKALATAVRIIILTLLLTGIEYITGLIFVKRFHVKLWDYSKQWGNIGGIVCPLFSLAWGAIGTSYCFLLEPHIEKLVSKMVSSPICVYLLGTYMGVLTVDLFYSFNIVSKIKKWAVEQKFDVRYENLKSAIQSRARALKRKHNFLLPFKSTEGIAGELENYRNSERENPK